MNSRNFLNRYECTRKCSQIYLFSQWKCKNTLIQSNQLPQLYLLEKLKICLNGLIILNKSLDTNSKKLKRLIKFYMKSTKRFCRKEKSKGNESQSILDFLFEQEGSVFVEPENCCSKITLQKISVDRMVAKAT